MHGLLLRPEKIVPFLSRQTAGVPELVAEVDVVLSVRETVVVVLLVSSTDISDVVV